jgi:DNA-binding XRE family transcriptional regulator
MSQFADNIWFTVVHCYKCNTPFGMTSELQQRRVDDHKGFFCPNGHEQFYQGKTEAQKLKIELERQRQITEAAQARASKAENEREQVAKAHKKMRNRIMNGVCPCCNRTFQNLLSHMKAEHPEFREFKTLPTLRAAFGMTQSAVAREAGVLTTYISNHERDKPVPTYAKARIDGWIAKHNTKIEK